MNTREIAIALINAETYADADAVLANVTGRQVAELAGMFGVHLSGRGVAHRRRTLVYATIGIALDHVAIVYAAHGRSWDAERAAAGARWLAAYRARRINELPAE